VCDEYGFCQPNISESEDSKAFKVALIVVSVLFGVFIIGTVAVFLWLRRKRVDYKAI
jgi:hypothetical protein